MKEILEQNLDHEIFGLTHKIDVEHMRLIFSAIEWPERFFKKLIGNFEENFRNRSETTLTPPTKIFIASPQNVASRFSKIKNFGKYQIFTGEDTFEFLNQYTDKCQVIADYFGDILSTLEKEISSRAISFYRSRPSNWSFNVQARRFAEDVDLELDRVVFDVL